MITTVAISIERYLAVVHPFTKFRWEIKHLESPINFPKEKFIKSYQKKFSIRLSLIPSLIKIIYLQTPVLIPSLCHPCPPLHHMLQFAKVFRVHHSVSRGSDWSRKQHNDLLRQQHHHLQRHFPEKLFLPRETTCCQGAEVN